MDANWAFLLDMVVLLAMAMALGTVAERLKQNAIIGYLTAGLLMGPHALGLTADPEKIQQITVLGVTLMMFVIGLEFSPAQLKLMGPRPIIMGFAQVLVTILVAVPVYLLLGVEARAAIAVGAIIAMTSTELVLPSLAARSELDSLHGRLSGTIVVLQDTTVVPLMLLVSALSSGGGGAAVLMETGKSLLVLAAFIGVFILFSRFVLPHVLRLGASVRNRDVPILFAVVVAIGSAWLANHFGLSPALGAFLGGVFLGDSVVASQLRGDIAPLRVLFVTLFFASIGMYADPVWIARHPHLLLASFALIALLKAAVVLALALMLKYPLRYAVATGVCVTPMGVFSFVLLDAARGLIGEGLFRMLVATAIVMMFLTPWTVRGALPTGLAVERFIRRFRRRDTRPVDKLNSAPVAGHVVIVGYGPAGRSVARVMREKGEKLVVIDLNATSVHDARHEGFAAFLGDANSRELLDHLQLANAKAVIVTLPDHRATLETISHVRAIAPNVRVIARARYHRYAADLTRAGAHAVIDEEMHVGEALGQASLKAI